MELVRTSRPLVTTMPPITAAIDMPGAAERFVDSAPWIPRVRAPRIIRINPAVLI
jgi:hypothetical protein